MKPFDYLPGAVTTAVIDVEDMTCGEDLVAGDEALQKLRQLTG